MISRMIPKGQNQSVRKRIDSSATLSISMHIKRPENDVFLLDEKPATRPLTV